MKRDLAAHGVSWTHHRELSGSYRWKLAAGAVTAEVVDRGLLTFWNVCENSKIVVHSESWSPHDGIEPVLASLLRASKAVINLFERRAERAADILVPDRTKEKTES